MDFGPAAGMYSKSFCFIESVATTLRVADSESVESDIDRVLRHDLISRLVSK